MKPYLSIIIPSYNEMKNIKKNVLDELFDYLNKQNYTWEVLLSDDGSTDGTTEALVKLSQKDKRIRVVKNIHAGKGPTVQSGMLKAKGEWILFTDFDQSTPIREIEKLFKYKKNHQVIIGSREISGAQRGKEPLYRHIMGKGFNFIVQALAIPGIQDTQCGFKLFEHQANYDIFSNLIVYGRTEERQDAFTGAFDVEALFLANKKGYKVKEVPITWHHNETDRVSPLKDSVRMLRDIIKIRITDLLGKYSK